MFRFAAIAAMTAAILSGALLSGADADNASPKTPVYRIEDYPYPTAPALLQWQSVLNRDAAQEARWTGAQCSDGEPRLDCAAKEMALLEDKLRDRPRKEQVAEVYRYFNAVKYKEHGHGCGPDCWATRLDFIAKRQGDCGDHALAEYFTLRRLGFAERDLQLIIAQLPGFEDSFKGGHVVLRVRADDDYFILDNRRDRLADLQGLGKYKVLAGLNADSVQIYNLVTPTPPPGFVSDATQMAALVVSPGSTPVPETAPESAPVQVASLAPEPAPAKQTVEAAPEPAAIEKAAPVAAVAASATSADLEAKDEDCVQSAQLSDWNPNLPCTPRMKIKVVAKDSPLQRPASVALEPSTAPAESAPDQLIAIEPDIPTPKSIVVATADATDAVASSGDEADDQGGCVQIATSLADWNPNLPCVEVENPYRIDVKAKSVVKAAAVQ